VQNIYKILCVKGILNSLVSIWQSEHYKKNDPVKYKIVGQLLISDLG